MRIRSLFKVLAIFCAGLAHVYVGFGPIAEAQVVLLPSVSNYSYSGGAWVPDAGSASLSGNSYRSSTSSNLGWGPYSARSSGNMYGTSSSSVSVQVIDLEALDEAILSAKPSSPPASVAAKLSGASAGSSSRSIVGGSPVEGPGPSIDPGKWQRVLAGGHPSHPAHNQLADSDIRYFLKMGQEAEAANRIVSARVYYRMAADAMTPQMKARYERSLDERAAAEKAAAATAKADRTRY